MSNITPSIAHRSRGSFLKNSSIVSVGLTTGLNLLTSTSHASGNSPRGVSRMNIPYGGFDLDVAYRLEGRDLDNCVFMIHGMGCFKENFDGAFHYLAGQTLLAVDLPGYGDSSKPQGFSYAIQDYAALCQLLLDTLGIRNVHVVGHSMGAATATLLAERLGDRALSLSNIDGRPIVDDLDPAAALITDTPYDEFVDTVYDQMLAGLKPVDPRFHSFFSKTNADVIHKSGNSHHALAVTHEILNLFNKLELPKSFVYGEHLVPKATIAALENTEIIEISNSAHFMMLDNPEEFYDKLSEFLSLTRAT